MDQAQNMDQAQINGGLVQDKVQHVDQVQRLCDVVQINVGGTVFTTTLQTLHRCSYFKELDSIPSFIDRNPLYFGAILDFLRGSPLMLPPNGNYAQMKMECAYFGLHGKEKKSTQELWLDNRSFINLTVIGSADGNTCTIEMAGCGIIFKNYKWQKDWDFISPEFHLWAAFSDLMEYMYSIGFIFHTYITYDDTTSRTHEFFLTRVKPLVL